MLRSFNRPEKNSERLRSAAVFAFLVFAFILYWNSGWHDQVTREKLQEFGNRPLAALIIIATMTVAWTFALPASIFFFVTPFFFPPLLSAGIICSGCAAGTTMGYVVARFAGGPWVERFRDSRPVKFLEVHSSFLSIFAVRVFPSSPHGLLNYGAGMLRIPFFKFLAATMCGVGIKAILYSAAISSNLEARSIQDALTWQTLTILLILAILAIAGHTLQRKWANGLMNNPAQ
jgi:uncharacterized membrane protein YdjX (TVP38/TMEM64 family)